MHGQVVHLYIYYNAKKAADEFDAFNLKLLKRKEELESNCLNKKYEEEYEKFFIVEKTAQGQVVKFNKEEIRKSKKKYAGFFGILSNMEIQPKDVLQIYRNKEAVENCFDDLKNQLDMKRLRIQGEEAMNGRMFLQFLALILISQIRVVIQNDPVMDNWTISEVMDNLKVFTRITGPTGSFYSEQDSRVKCIFSAFGISF
jgi:transposase